MAGHSKWSSIKHKKKANDEKKSKLFSKLADNIKTSLKNGNDINKNFKLKNAVDKALNNNISKTVISKIIFKKKEFVKNNTIYYSAILPEGVVFILECYPDNKNKIISDLKYLFLQVSGSIIQFKNIEYIFNKFLKLEFLNHYNEEYILNKLKPDFITNFLNNDIFLTVNNLECLSNFIDFENTVFQSSFIFKAKKNIFLDCFYLKKLNDFKKRIIDKTFICKIFSNIDGL